MAARLSNVERYRVVRERNKKFDGVFYFAKRKTGIYCHPSCPAPHPSIVEYLFFDTASEAGLMGFRACGRCRLNESKKDLTTTILDGIGAGVINDQGVSGFAHSLHMSERQLRRIVQQTTGLSPSHLNRKKRLSSAKYLIAYTRLPITDIAFRIGFSSLRQFNTVFKNTFNISPREMRKNHPDDSALLLDP